MLFLKKGWNNKIKVKKINDRNLDGIFGISHATQRKLFAKCNFFYKNPQKVIEE